MHINFLFYFLIFIHFCQLILSTNLLEKIDEFSGQFKRKLEELEEKINEIGGKEIIKNQKFNDAMFKFKEFPSKIENTKNELEKYLNGEKSFTDILKAMNDLKLEEKNGKFKALKIQNFGLNALDDMKLKEKDEKFEILKVQKRDFGLKSLNDLKLEVKEGKFKALKSLKKDFENWIAKFGKNSKVIHRHGTRNSNNLIDLKGQELIPFKADYHDLQKQLELVNFLLGMHKFLNEFVEEFVKKLRIYRIENFLKTLDPRMNEQKAELNKPYNDFVMKYSNKYFPEIEKLIKDEKNKLQKVYDTSLQKNIDIKALMAELVENKQELEYAISNENPFLEKWDLKQSKNFPNYNEIMQHFAKINELHNNAVENRNTSIYKKLLGDFEMTKEFRCVRSEWDNFNFLNIASTKILNQIGLLINGNIIENDEKNLAEIYWLAKIIEKKLDEIETKFIEQKMDEMKLDEMKKLNEMDEATDDPIYDMAIAAKMEELPKELELKNGKIDLKNKAILIAKNIIFIVIQLDKCHGLKEIAMKKAKELIMIEIITEEMIMKKMARREEIMQQKIVEEITKSLYLGQLFYQNYKENKKNEGMEQMKIYENGTAAGESSSSTNL